MKKNVPEWAKYIALDVISECYPVSDELGRKLWSFMQEEPSREGLSPGDFLGINPNLLEYHLDKFTDEELEEIKQAIEEEG